MIDHADSPPCSRMVAAPRKDAMSAAAAITVFVRARSSDSSRS
jgi:hypothetical protein